MGVRKGVTVSEETKELLRARTRNKGSNLARWSWMSNACWDWVSDWREDSPTGDYGISRKSSRFLNV